MVIISSITGVRKKDIKKRDVGKKRKGDKTLKGGKTERKKKKTEFNKDDSEGSGEEQEEEEESEESGESEEEEEEEGENESFTPGLSFWIAVNEASGLCQSFEERVRKKFSSAAFAFCDRR